VNLAYKSATALRIDLPPWGGERFAQVVRRFNLAKEQALRNMARPYLEAGYLPEELQAVEREPDLGHSWEPYHVFLCVQVTRPRSAARLWLRRMMLRAGLRPAVRALQRDIQYKSDIKITSPEPGEGSPWAR
jgi:hypothetical protein